MLLLYCFCFGCLSLSATEKEVPNYYFSHISGEDGLSQSNVKAILQDSYGFMWFGTKNGLNRFDGTSIVLKNCDDNVAGTGNHNISALFEYSGRKLWVGTDKGVYRYDPVQDVFTFMDLKTEAGVDMSNWVAQIVSDLDGNIWILIPDQGVFRYRDEKLYFYEIAKEKHFKTGAPVRICARFNGEVWLTTWEAGLFRYEASADTFELLDRSNAGDWLEGRHLSMICDYDDWIAMAVYEGELMKYNPKPNQRIKIDLPEAEHTYISNVICLGDELWVGTNDGAFVVMRRRIDMPICNRI